MNLSRIRAAVQTGCGCLWSLTLLFGIPVLIGAAFSRSWPIRLLIAGGILLVLFLMTTFVVCLIAVAISEDIADRPGQQGLTKAVYEAFTSTTPAVSATQQPADGSAAMLSPHQITQGTGSDRPLARVESLLSLVGRLVPNRVDQEEVGGTLEEAHKVFGKTGSVVRALLYVIGRVPKILFNGLSEWARHYLKRRRRR